MLFSGATYQMQMACAVWSDLRASGRGKLLATDARSSLHPQFMWLKRGNVFHYLKKQLTFRYEAVSMVPMN